MAGGAGGVNDDGRIARTDLRDLRLQPIQIAFRWADQLFVTHQLGMVVIEHRGIVDDDDGPHIRQAVDDRQDLIDVFLIFRDEDHRAAITQLIFDLRCGRGRINTVDDRAQRLRCQIADHPLFASVPHDGDAFAFRQADAGKRLRGPRHQQCVIAETALAINAKMFGAERHPIRTTARALA